MVVLHFLVYYFVMYSFLCSLNYGRLRMMHNIKDSSLFYKMALHKYAFLIMLLPASIIMVTETLNAITTLVLFITALITDNLFDKYVFYPLLKEYRNNKGE